MGVQNLWQLLSPCGRRINIESLSRKTLAVDVSIWLVQFIKAMRDEDGKMVRNAHLIGTFRRIAKLLFHGIKPVFVFDGGVPILKRRTIANRRSNRKVQSQNLREVAQTILVAQLKRQIDEARKLEQLGKGGGVKLTTSGDAFTAGFNPGAQVAAANTVAPSPQLLSVPSTTTAVVGHRSTADRPRDGESGLRLDSTSSAPLILVEDGDDDDDDDEDDIEWEDGDVRNVASDDDSEGEGAWNLGGLEKGSDAVDNIDESSLMAMPVSMRKGIIETVKREFRKKSRDSYLNVAADMDAYSSTQVTNFLRVSKFNRKVWNVAKEVGSSSDGKSSSSSSSGSGSPSSSIGSGSPSSSGERNFFLAVGFTKPHLPFVFPSKYWRLYDKGEQQTPVPLAPQPRRQKGAPPWAVELGAELFSFSDTAPLKKRAKQRLVTHNAAAAGRSGGGAGGHRRGSGGVTADRNKEASQVSDVVDFDDVDDVGGLDRSEGGRTLSASLERHLRKGYFAATSFVDAQVGRVVAEADRLHLLETNTVVCLLGDHGWKLGDHGGWSKLSNVEQDTRVPLIVTLPRALASQHLAPAATRSLVQTSNALVELVDLFPSLAHLATGHDPSTMTMAVGGVKLQRLEGNSFANVLLERPTLAPAVPSSLSSLPGRDHHGRHRRSVKVADEEKVVWKRAVFSQVPRSFGGGGVVGRRRKKKLAMMGYSMRTQRFRLTLWVDCGSALSVDVSQRPMRISLDPSFHVTNQRVRSQVVATELYDLRLDPHEGDNKFQNASYAGALQGLLSDWRAGWEGARGALPLPLDQRVL